MKEEFEDTKGAISIRISKKNRQHNGQKKKYKGTNNYKTKDRVTRTPLTPVLRKGSSSCSTSDTRRVNLVTNKGNNKITELRTILQRESKNSISR